jgi:hypothetical protein
MPLAKSNERAGPARIRRKLLKMCVVSIKKQKLNLRIPACVLACVFRELTSV